MAMGYWTRYRSGCVALIAVGVIIGRGNDTGSTHAAATQILRGRRGLLDHADHAKLSAAGSMLMVRYAGP